MVNDLIVSLNLKKCKNQEYAGIKREYYATYDNQILILGRKEEIGKLGDKYACRDEFAYAFEFDLSEDSVIEAFIKIELCEAKPVFYWSWWQEKEHEVLETPYCKGYCLLEYVHNKTAYSFEWAIKDRKRDLAIINTPSFKQTLREWVALQPTDISPETECEVNRRNHMLKFISHLDFLLLSEDSEIRDLFLQYKRDCYSFHCSDMSMRR